jgi:hypothetical protein
MGSRARGAFLVVVACALSGIGCFEPLQSGGVMIVGDPADRIAAMCRFRHRDSVSDLCGIEASEGEAAR